MQFQYIKDETCPTCGSRTISESCYHIHTNGQGFEERKFECGCVLEWVPNFERLILKKNCPKSPEEIAKKQKRLIAAKKTFNFIMELDVDDEFKQKLGYELQCVKVS